MARRAPEPVKDEAELRRERVQSLLTDGMSRGEVKRAARELDADAALRALLVQLAPHLPDDAADWPSKKLLRRARDREDDAHVRTNLIARDEAFTCAHCAAHVPAHGRTARDHCPHCLRSLHVDVVPGDRQAACGGILDPIAVDGMGGEHWRLAYRCRRCGKTRHNRVLQDGDPPDDWKLVVSLSAAR